MAVAWLSLLKKGKIDMLEANNIIKTFGRRTILNGLTFKAERGRVIGIFGESGSGKTTFLKILSTLLKPDSGTLALDSVAFSSFARKQKEAFRLENISIITSDADLLSPLTVKENVLFPLELQKSPFDEVRFLQLCDQLKLNHLLDKVADSLSSGEKQRVAILRALMLEKTILIADEPTSHLDQDMSLEVMALIKKETQSFDKISICSCHDETLAPCFDELYHLNNGILSHYEK